MTSSLVGSEMCIRDRAQVAAHGESERRLLQALEQERLRLSPPTAPTPFPVSYTHLTLPTICSV
eukprot:4962164-Prorocentrum_lima.AAC.1